MESVLFMIDAVAIVTLALWALLDERRPKGQKLTSPFRMLETSISKTRQRRFSQNPRGVPRR